MFGIPLPSTPAWRFPPDSPLAQAPFSIGHTQATVAGAAGQSVWPALAASLAVLLGTLGVLLLLWRTRRHTAPAPAGQPAGLLTRGTPMGTEHPTPSTTAQGGLGNQPWIQLVEDCVALFDELDSLAGRMDPGRREMAEHINSRLGEILERAGVTPIAGEVSFDRTRHQPEPAGIPAQPGNPIAVTISPGFAIDRWVLRRARVRLTETQPA